jgi:hypothetical protein
MKCAVMGIAIILILTLSAATMAGEFKVYPGAKVDQKATEEARRLADSVRKQAPRMAASTGEPTIYVTTDPIEKVFEFYRGIAKEYQMPGPKEKKLPSGQALKQAFFIFDGASDLASSKLWAKIQRPYVGDLEFKDIRDITAIVMSERR